MREIKFRAWDYKNDEMKNWDYVRTNWTLAILNGDSRTAIMQFTGLKKRNGKEIYEGDIIRLAGYGVYEVSWPFRELFDAAAEGDIETVLGNIYENPDLLKV